MNKTVGPEKLPVWGTLHAAFRETRLGFDVYRRLALMPFVLWLLWPAFIFFEYDGLVASVRTDRNTFDTLWPIILGVGLIFGLGFAALVPTVTAWHRYLILGPDHPAARLRYSIGREEWRYTKIIVALACLLFAGKFVIEALLVGFIGGVGSLIFWIFLARWSLLLPASAIGQLAGRDVAARMARGNTLRLWFVTILPEAIGWSLEFLLQTVLFDMNNLTRGTDAVGRVLSVVITFLVLPVTVGVLSIAYRRLGRPLAEATA